MNLYYFLDLVRIHKIKDLQAIQYDTLLLAYINNCLDKKFILGKPC